MSLPQILILHGPNLNILNLRNKHHYGGTDFVGYFNQLKQKFEGKCGLHLIQLDDEAGLIKHVQQAHIKFNGIVINAGGLSHTSVALADAAACSGVPIIAIHISNTHIREDFRKHDLLAPACSGAIIGLGLPGYDLAIDQLLDGQT